MEFDFPLSYFIPDGISVIIPNLTFRGQEGSIQEIRTCQEEVGALVNRLGLASAKAQNLIEPVTDRAKFSQSEQLIYVLTEIEFSSKKKMILGFLKIGPKRLFLFDETAYLLEKDTLCVLDFYIHESKRREGYGKRLFDFMLQDQCILPEQLPIDRPTTKSMQFFYKHYGLDTVIPQANNFIVFDKFFKHV